MQLSNDFIYVVLIVGIVAFVMDYFLIFLLAASILAILTKPQEETLKLYLDGIIKQASNKAGGNPIFGKLIYVVANAVVNFDYQYSDYIFCKVATVEYKSKNTHGIYTF